MPRQVQQDGDEPPLRIAVRRNPVATAAKQDAPVRAVQFHRRFERIDTRFDGVDGRFQQIDRRFEQVDRRFEGLERYMNLRFDGLAAEMNRRFDRVDEKFDRPQLPENCWRSRPGKARGRVGYKWLGSSRGVTAS